MKAATFTGFIMIIDKHPTYNSVIYVLVYVLFYTIIQKGKHTQQRGYLCYFYYTILTRFCQLKKSHKMQGEFLCEHTNLLILTKM